MDLLDDLKALGPVLSKWLNYSVLSKKDRTHHCHVSYHWVAYWQETIVGIEIEVYYVGSRENAPY